MTRIFLCDDDSATAYKYARLISELAEKNHIEAAVSVFNSGENLLFSLLDSPDSADIIYLDILMENVNGMDAAKTLREHGCKAEIVFLTTSREFVYDAFDLAPVQYLLKDSTTAEKFEQVFLKAASLAAKKTGDLFLFEAGGVSRMIPIRDISYFEIWKRIVAAHDCGGGSLEFYQSLANLQEKLKDKDFVRIHRSYLVNLSYIARFENRRLFLKTGESLPIGGTYAKSVRQSFSEYAVRTREFQWIK